MLRKTYRLMQKTQHAVAARGEEWRRQIQSGSGATLLSFHACPPDIWPGVVARGQELVRFVARLTDDQLDIVVGPQGRHDIDAAFHEFGWLRDLRTVSDEAARRTAIRLIARWAAVNNGLSGWITAPERARARIFALIGAYAFYAPGLDAATQEAVRVILKQDLDACKRAFSLGTPHPMDAFDGAAALFAGSVAVLYDKAHQARYLQQFEHAVAQLILADGGPYTRRPGDLPGVLKTLIDLRHLLAGAGVPIPAHLAHGIDRCVPALRFFRLGDGALTVAHGSGEGQADVLEQILHFAQINARAPLSLPQTGFERLATLDQTVIVDCGAAQGTHHAGTTAFEWGIGQDRVVVNCGSHRSDPMWRDLLSATAAHSTLTLGGDSNIPVRGPAHVETERLESDDGMGVRVTHEGYAARNGLTHTRQIFLDQDGCAIRGLDDVTGTIPPVVPIPYSIRFHLHPRVTVNLLQGGGALLKLSSGRALRFAHDAEELRLEESVYLGATGLPQKTRQLVLSGDVYAARKTIRWAFRQEG